MWTRPDEELKNDKELVFFGPNSLCLTYAGRHKESHYHWLHVPSGKTGLSSAKFVDHITKLSCLNHWNQSPDWKYWED